MSTERWTISWGDREWSEDDLLGVHLMLMVEGSGIDGWDIQPTAGPRRLLACLAAFIAVDEERDYAQVAADLLTKPAALLLDALQIVSTE